MANRRKTGAMVYLDAAVLAALNALATETSVPRAVLIRNAIDDYLALVQRRRHLGHSNLLRHDKPKLT